MTLDRDRLLAVGWIALCAGALLAPALDTAHIVGYRILCHNVTSDWGANRTNLCAGALGESIISVGGVVVWLSVLVAAFGSLACGVAGRSSAMRCGYRAAAGERASGCAPTPTTAAGRPGPAALRARRTIPARSGR